jgi:hypothetical protein
LKFKYKIDMKKQFLILCLLISLAGVISCSKKAEHLESDQTENALKEEGDEWKEMDDFHMVMAETFHPYKDSSNLEPIKSHVNDLVAAAKKWIDSPVPEKVNNEEVKSKLNQLQEEVLVLKNSVKTGPDSLIANALTKLHNTFHEIQEHWYEHSEKEEDHEHR